MIIILVIYGDFSASCERKSLEVGREVEFIGDRVRVVHREKLSFADRNILTERIWIDLLGECEREGNEEERNEGEGEAGAGGKNSASHANQASYMRQGEANMINAAL